MVEDDPATIRALRAILHRRGCEVVVASTVAEALPQLATRPDAMVLDLMLPDGNGLQVLKRLRDENLPIRVAVTTGASDTALLKAVASLRPELILIKPINLPELLSGLGVEG